MEKKNRSLLIFSGYHLPHLGGIERYTDNLAKEFKRVGWDITIVSSNYDNLKTEETINDIINYRLPIYNLFKSRYPIPKFNKDYKNIIDKLNQKKYDAIIVNTRFHLTSLVGARYGRNNKIPVFLIEHGSQHLTIDNKVLDFFGAIYEHFLTMYIKKFINYYYGVSKEACKWQKHFGITSNGVWYNSISDFSKDYKIEKSEKNIIITYAGRILKQKGLIELINAFNKVSKKHKNAVLNIAGDGNLLEELKENNQNDKIIFWGKIDFEELCNLYRKTNIFVYAPNWPEGLPTGILEAGLMDCAVISSKQGGCKEIIIDKENGIMINNEEELKKALEELINNKELRTKYSSKLKEKIKKEFVWEETAKKIKKDIENGIKNYEK